MASQTEKDTAEAASKTQKRSPHTQTRSPHTQTRSPHTQTESVNTQKRSPDTVLSTSHRDHPSNQNSQVAQGSGGGERGTTEGGGAPSSRHVAGLDASSRYIPEATNRARESAANLLPRDNMGGGRDPFYVFDRTISSSDPIDYGLYDIPPASNFATEEEEERRIPSAPHSFQIVKVPGEDRKVRVAIGTVSSETPGETDHNIENATQFSMSDGDSLYLKVDLDEDDQSVTDVTIQKTRPDEDETTAEVRLGSVVVSDNKIIRINQFVTGSLDLSSCGDNHFFAKI